MTRARTTWGLRACALSACAWWCIATGARAQDSVAVEVVDVAGGRAYVQPGTSAGVRRGSTITVGKRSFDVVAASAGHAVIEHDGRVRIGDHGKASVVPESVTQARRLPTPTPLAAFEGQWPAPERPADRQHPKHVPLGPMRAGRSSAALSLAGGALVPTSGGEKSVERGEVRGRLHVEPFHDYPLRLDADAAAQLWLADNLDQRLGKGARRPVRVRQAEVAYGDAARTFAALGRLRYASSTLGMLDGGRAQAELFDGFTLGAFGGVVPDPLDGVLQTDAARFGAEVGYAVPDADVRPRLSLSAQGSHFDGGLDERRLVATADVFPDDAHAGAYAELSLYDSNNPWGASAQELSAAGVDGSVTFGVVELGARADVQRPERSRWLAKYLPPGYLCTSNDPVDDTPCFGDEARYLGGLAVDVRLDRVAFGASADGSTSQRGGEKQLGGSLHTRVLNVVGPVRLEAAVLANEGTLVHMLGGRVGLGAELVPGVFDVSVHDQPALTRYDADSDNYVENTVGLALWWTPEAEFELSLDADLVTGRDVDVFLVQTLMTVRPEF